MGLTSSVNTSAKKDHQDSGEMSLYNLPYDLLLNISQYLAVREIHALQLVSHILALTMPHYISEDRARHCDLLDGFHQGNSFLTTSLRFYRHAKLYKSSPSHGLSIENSLTLS